MTSQRRGPPEMTSQGRPNILLPTHFISNQASYYINFGLPKNGQFGALNLALGPRAICQSLFKKDVFILMLVFLVLMFFIHNRKLCKHQRVVEKTLKVYERYDVLIKESHKNAKMDGIFILFLFYLFCFVLSTCALHERTA